MIKEEFIGWYKIMKPDRKYFWEVYYRSRGNIESFEDIIRTKIETAQEKKYGG